MKGKELAIKYLSLRDRTVAEMRKYLIEKQQSSEEAETIIHELINSGYLNDEKYTRDYIFYGRTKNRGLLRIKKELNSKGITAEILEDALIFIKTQEELDKNNVFFERQRAEELALSWVKGREIEEKLLKKIARKLEALGYEGDTIYSVIGVLMAMRSEDNGRD